MSTSKDTTTIASAADILSVVNQTPTETVSAPGLEQPVRMCGLTGVEKAELFKSCADEKGIVDDEMLEVMVVIYCARDASGKRLFRDDQYMEVRNLPQRTLRPLIKAAWKLSGYGPEAMSDIAKNLPEIPNDDT